MVKYYACQIKGCMVYRVYYCTMYFPSLVDLAAIENPLYHSVLGRCSCALTVLYVISCCIIIIYTLP